MNIEQLKDSKGFLQKLMEVAVTPIFVVDENMIVQSYNDSFATLFNKSEYEIIGRLPGNSLGCAYLNEGDTCGKTENCVKCILRKQMEEVIKKNLTIEKNIIEKEFRINGKVVKKHLSIMIKPMDFDGRKFYIGIFNDVTDIVELKSRVYSQYEKMRRDLLFARGLQSGLLPSSNRIGPLRFSYIYKPCETVGGDFIDFYRIDRHNAGFIIADVAGHGITSSMFTIFLYSMLNRDEKSPARLLAAVFEEFQKFNVTTETYITMLAAVINTRKKTVVFANAGFTNPPGVAYAKETVRVDISGIPISNWVGEASYEEREMKFRNGDRLIFFSDGITEMRTDSSSFIGGDYLYDTLADRSMDAQALINSVFSNSSDNKSYILNDDITIALVDYL
ncbi:MAG: SpoIIE family protein phosphatase [Clostridia bacterium]|nr:SpoIIE family protein phosphatase [Clostridia bacterium]